MPFLPYHPSLRERARALRNNATPAERILWEYLRRKALGVEFHRQVPVNHWIIDFFCPEIMLGIELDGTAHDQRESEDMARQHRLESLGIRIIRFQNEEVFQELERVLEEIRAHIPPAPFEGGENQYVQST